MIGILIGTVVADGYLKIIDFLKKCLYKSGKKHYEVLVGKINEPKLKNMAVIDMYILIACPEQSMVEFK